MQIAPQIADVPDTEARYGHRLDLYIEILFSRGKNTFNGGNLSLNAKFIEFNLIIYAIIVFVYEINRNLLKLASNIKKYMSKDITFQSSIASSSKFILINY